LATSASREPSPAAQAERHEDTTHVQRLLAGLPRNQREVVRLKFQNGLSYKEISRITNLSVSNVGFLIHTAIKTLRQQMQQEEGGFQP
jgi:RNA polymerase sigma-70 factor (ECF subfamily)